MSHWKHASPYNFSKAYHDFIRGNELLPEKLVCQTALLERSRIFNEYNSLVSSYGQCLGNLEIRFLIACNSAEPRTEGRTFSISYLIST